MEHGAALSKDWIVATFFKDVALHDFHGSRMPFVIHDFEVINLGWDAGIGDACVNLESAFHQLTNRVRADVA